MEATKKMYILFRTILFLVCLFPFFSLGQKDETNAKIKTIFIFNFTKYVDHADWANLSSFKIGVFSKNKFLKDELKKLAAAKKIGNVPIEIVEFTTIPADLNVQIFYADAYVMGKTIIEKATGKGVLYISEEPNYDDCMISFVTVNEKVSFLLNSKLLKDEGFVVSTNLESLALSKNQVERKSSGKETETLNFTDDQSRKQGKWIIYSKENNAKIHEGNYLNDKKEGPWKEFYPDGTVKSIITFTNNRPDGSVQIFNVNGGYKETGTWKNNRWVGLYRLYTDDEKLVHELYFNEAGKRTGEQKFYYESGKLKTMAVFEDGKENGWAVNYSPEGKKISEFFYENGKKIEEKTKIYSETSENFEQKSPETVNDLGKSISKITESEIILKSQIAERDAKMNAMEQLMAKTKSENENLIKDKQLNDLLIKQRELELLKQKTESQKKENEILILNKENELKKSELSKSELESSLKQKEIKLLNENKLFSEQELKSQKVFRNYLLGSLSVFFILLVFILIGYRNKQKANKIITQQKENAEMQKVLIEEKQKEILDSIFYAKRIQRALIGSEARLKLHLSDFFILYKPKDIVSGDFYWSAKSGSKFFMATADCTGHGVPGAFMSLLNISFLNEAVNEKGITEAHFVLNYVRTHLVTSLSDDEEGGKDGMDCALCCFDFENNKLEFACAMNPVGIIRNKELIDFKPDKMPVGKYDYDSRSFNLQKTDLQRGDLIVTYTDGYADQFGGPKGKKFKYKQLNNLLISNCAEPLNRQSEILNQEFEKWKGNLEQVDDVLVIGVRV